MRIFHIYNTPDKLKRKNAIFARFQKFEIAAKWAKNDQIWRSKKEKWAFFKVFHLAYIFFYFNPLFKKSVVFTI